MASVGLRAYPGHHRLRPGWLEGKRVIVTGSVDNIGKDACFIKVDLTRQEESRFSRAMASHMSDKL